MKFNKLFKTGLLALAICSFHSCSEDETGENITDGEGHHTQVYITDAPIDDPDVEAVFVTIAEVKINGKAIEGFQKTTVNLSSLQNGETQLLGDLELESGTTSNISLVLDNEADESGEAPGNFIMTTQGEKEALVATSEEINVQDDVEIMSSGTTDVILDFDLRKTIQSDEVSGGYSFVASNELASNIRAVSSAETGTVSGEVSGAENSETVVVFAYKEGDYNQSEMNMQNGINFSNAVTSSLVSNTSGDFELHFLEEGNYELHLASYQDSDNDGQLEFTGMLSATSATGISLNSINVEAESEVTLEILLSGVLDL